VREIRPYGSVRGVAGDRYPYRDLACPGWASKTRPSQLQPRRIVTVLYEPQ